MNYHVTELIPRPALRPERLQKLPPKVQAKLLPADPVFKAPKIIVPREALTPKVKPQEVEAPKVKMNNFMPAALKMTPGGARPVLIHTGEFQGSSVAPTVNAPIQKVQTGGFGDPNGLKPSENGKPGAKLIASAAGSFDMPMGPGQGNGSGGAKGIKGTVASANFGDGIATSRTRRRAQRRARPCGADVGVRDAGSRPNIPGTLRRWTAALLLPELRSWTSRIRFTPRKRVI